MDSIYTIYTMTGDIAVKKASLVNLRLRFHGSRITYVDGRMAFNDTYYIEPGKEVDTVFNYITAKYVVRSNSSDCYMMIADDAAAHSWLDMAYYNYAHFTHLDRPSFRSWYADQEHALYINFERLFIISGAPADVNQLLENWHYDSAAAALYVEEEHD